MRAAADDLEAFLAVARERSFTKAAAQLGVSQSALSHTIRRLETGLGLRLLARSTRSVAPTDAGQRLIDTIGPRFAEIGAELDAITALRDKPAGAIRLTAGDHSLRTVIWPRLGPFLGRYPDIRVEISTEGALTDIVAERYDAGVRLGESIAKDMIAVRIGPDWSMAVVGAPAYFERRMVPRTPRDLTAHDCINLRLMSYGGYYAWEFEKDGTKLNVRVDGQLAFNASPPILAAALDGHGLACIPEDTAAPYIASGQLKRVLKDWMPRFVGYHLYYPSRRQASPAFDLLVDALRFGRADSPRINRAARPSFCAIAAGAIHPRMIRTLALIAALVLAPLPALAGQFVDFAGYTWLVRSYGGGPGPNEWRESNVFVDQQGLHLTIQKVGGVWTCAEVFMVGPALGFGTYEFEVSGDLAKLDTNAVLGLFNYPASGDVGPDGTNEIDIEIAQWGDLNNPNRLNWNVYPSVAGGGKGNHALPLTLPAGTSSHRFKWSAKAIDYASFEGAAGAGDMASIGNWTYAPKNARHDVPQVPLVVHMNLWLTEGRAPSDGAPIDVVIRDFRFTPAQ